MNSLREMFNVSKKISNVSSIFRKPKFYKNGSAIMTSAHKTTPINSREEENLFLFFVVNTY